MSRTREDALAYHRRSPAGKIEVVPTKGTATQRDLSLAYTPGVAEPCREIAENPLDAYEYTAKGNLVAVISNGTAVLGLGDIGALASKPVMEGKGVLFKRFAGLDVFDLELTPTDPDELVSTIRALEPTFGGINLEDIKAPECFEVEARLREELSIPVFHDDQHGTAIIAGAALLNALDLNGKRIEDVKVVVSGAGAAALGCVRLWRHLGLEAENVLLCDSKGVVYEGRTEGMNEHKREYAVRTEARTLADALVGADVFIGLSVAGILEPEMLESMAEQPIVFALANPDPEIDWDTALATRSDVIMATGRSDYPNQVNNVLGFPFIFRGALDVRATEINVEMMLAATKALATLAREDVPDSVLRAYDLDQLSFGPNYLIPKPFDHRVLLTVPAAVAQAAKETGVAQRPIEDLDDYTRSLERLVSARLVVMHAIRDRARRDPKRIVFPEGEHDKILRAAKEIVDSKMARPILLAREEMVLGRLDELGVSPDDVDIVWVEDDERSEEFARIYHERRRRDGVTLEDARKAMKQRNVFGPMMVERGEAHGLLSGLTQDYSETIRPALRIIDTKPGVERVSGAYILAFKDRLLFLADTTVNIEPTAEQLAEIARLTANFSRRFSVEPRVAFISFSNFGSNTHASAVKARRAAEILARTDPELESDGEMQADTAIVRSILEEHFPWSRLKGPANVLVFPELNSANAAYKLIWRLAGAEAIGPVLLGMARPVHVLQRGVDVSDIVNMAALCVLDAQEIDSKS